MSASNLQVLMHAGELEYIVENIKESRRTYKVIGGCLFGLWRNSLVQPVVQFVTGHVKPSKNLEGQEIDNIINGEFVEKFTSTMLKNHSLVRLGFWFTSFEENFDEFRESVLQEFQNRNKDKLLLFINYTEDSGRGNIIGEYDLSNSTIPLYKEDILDGHSSFRKYDDLTQKIGKNRDLVVPPGISEDQDVRPEVNNLIAMLPSRTQTSEASIIPTQWYSTDQGMELLQKLMQCFNSQHITPEMSRDATTHNLQFNLNRDYALVFPPNFPKSLPVLHNSFDGKINFKRNEIDKSDVCGSVVRAVVRKIQSHRR
ncbi:uncharacterized protein LOC124453026 [Xenia sp. Carnegie-2017]|uniref:uncharacterized protein LOC124453026 n=1 Tax=Xenia sp. Carnegie-2017 TaxID=2897299 RepID=UPI001F04EAF8|nr:uncharacterized protein LOC124453026 [Xenia sp. Carnegie-2017]